MKNHCLWSRNSLHLIEYSVSYIAFFDRNTFFSFLFRHVKLQKNMPWTHEIWALIWIKTRKDLELIATDWGIFNLILVRGSKIILAKLYTGGSHLFMKHIDTTFYYRTISLAWVVISLKVGCWGTPALKDAACKKGPNQRQFFFCKKGNNLLNLT